MKAVGIQASTYHRIHAALSARLMPVLAGPKALEALKAYAHMATGGRIAVVQVTNALAEPGDLWQGASCKEQVRAASRRSD